MCLYTALKYRSDLSIFDHHDDGIIERHANNTGRKAREPQKDGDEDIHLAEVGTSASVIVMTVRLTFTLMTVRLTFIVMTVRLTFIVITVRLKQCIRELFPSPITSAEYFGCCLPFIVSLKVNCSVLTSLYLYVSVFVAGYCHPPAFTVLALCQAPTREATPRVTEEYHEGEESNGRCQVRACFHLLNCLSTSHVTAPALSNTY